MYQYHEEHGAAQQLRARLITELCTHKGTYNQPSTAAQFMPILCYWYVALLGTQQYLGKACM